MPLPLYARGEFERKEDVTTTAVLLLASTKSRWIALAQCLQATAATGESVDAIRYANGRTLVHVAAATGSLAHVVLLSRVNEYQKDGLTALHVACQEGKVSMIERLLRLDADLSVTDQHGRTPFWYACEGGRIEIVRWLVSHPDGASVVNKADNEGNTPLHAACFRLRVEVVQLLVEHGGADIDAKNNADATPLLTTLTHSKLGFRGLVLRVAVVLVENFATVPDKAEIEKHFSKHSSEELITLTACCAYWKKSGALNADIPFSVLSNGAKAVQEFSACHVENFRRHRVCLVGQTESGKSSLIKTIVNRVPSKTHYFVRTIGIELTSWTFRDENGMFHQVTLWDFAGQDIYKPAHAPFFTEKTLFMLCVDLYAYKSKINEAMTHHQSHRVKILKHFAEASVLCWLRIIFSRQPKARVVLVGTKSDLVDTREIDLVWRQVNSQIEDWKSAYVCKAEALTSGACADEAQGISKNLEGFICPNTLVVNSVMEKDIEPMIIGIQEIVASIEVDSPLSDVIDVLREVYRRRQDANKKAEKERVEKLIIPKSDLTSNADALKELHNLGDVLVLEDYSSESCNGYVILEPKLIVDFIRQIVSHQLVDPNDAGKDPETLEALKRIRESGRVPHKFLAQLPLWRDCDDDVIVTLKMLFHRFQLMYAVGDVDMVFDPDVIVPLLWQHEGKVDLQPISKEYALTKLKPRKDAPYPTHLRWEYELKQEIPPTLFTHLAVAVHVPGVTPIVRAASIEVQDEKGEVFIARISIPMDKELGVSSHVVRLDVIAFDVREAWLKLKLFVCGVERVLEKYPGLKAGRYVEILPSESGVYRYNVDTSVESMKKRMEASGSAKYDETMLEWLPPRPIEIDWFVLERWQNTDTLETSSVAATLLDQHSSAQLFERTLWQLSRSLPSTRQLPCLWTLDFRPQRNNEVFYLRVYSDLTGICHHAHKLIEITGPTDVISTYVRRRYGVELKAGVSIFSNTNAASLDMRVLKIVVDQAKTVPCDQSDEPIRVYACIRNFVELTGDKSISSAGLDATTTISLMADLMSVREPGFNEREEMTAFGLAVGEVDRFGPVWASPDELSLCNAVPLSSPIVHPTSLVVEVRVIVDMRDRRMDEFELLVEFIDGGDRDCHVVSPSRDGGRANWSNVIVRSHSMKSINHIRKTTLLVKARKPIFRFLKKRENFTVNHRIGVGAIYSASRDFAFELTIRSEQDVTQFPGIISARKSLHRAADDGHAGFVNLLLDRAADINAKVSNGEEAIHRAAGSGHTDVIRLLLDRGANIEATTNNGEEALHRAAESGHTDVIRLLLDRGADIEAKTTYGETPLHRAAKSGQVSSVRLLLERKAKLHPRDEYGRTALGSVFANGVISTQRLLSTTQALIQAGAEMDEIAERELQSARGRDAVGAMGVCITRWREESARGMEMTTIPEEVFVQGSRGVMVYLSNLEKSTQSVYRHKICVVGPTTWGKTSLIKSLTSGRSRMEAIDIRTVGIDLFPYEFRHVGDSGETSLHEVTFWDFAGQDVYHTAHSVFFSSRTLFLVVLDLEAFKSELEYSGEQKANDRLKQFTDKYVVHWLRLIYARLPEAKVVFVGTKQDRVSHDEEQKIQLEVVCRLEQWSEELARSTSQMRHHTRSSLKFEAIKTAMRNWLVVSCADSASVVEMRDRLNGILMKQESAFLMPESYSHVLEEVRKRRGAPGIAIVDRLGRSFTAKNQFLDHLSRVVTTLEGDTTVVMRTFHELGEVIWYDDNTCLHPALASQAVLAPELVVHFIREAICHDIINIGNDQDQQQVTDETDASHQRRRQAYDEIRKHEAYRDWEEALHTRGQVSHAMLMRLPMWKELATVRPSPLKQSTSHVLTLKSLFQDVSLAYPEGTATMTETSNMIIPALWKLRMEYDPGMECDDFIDVARELLGFASAELHRCEWEYKFYCLGLPVTLFELIVVRSFHPDLKQVLTTPCKVISVVEGESAICIRCDANDVNHVIRVEAVAVSSTLARDVARFGCMAVELELTAYPGLDTERANIVDDAKTSVDFDDGDDEDDISDEVLWFRARPWKNSHALKEYPRLRDGNETSKDVSAVPDPTASPATAG